MTIVVTGGAGFIGSAVARHLVLDLDETVLNIDRLAYSSSAEATAAVRHDERYAFERADICDASTVARLFESYRPRAVIHLAAESHVDRSIDRPGDFVHTNVVGTYTLLEAARAYLDAHPTDEFRFVHVSTDEVFGTLGSNGAFSEESPYRPNSPYSATKAASDHLARAWFHTYGLPTIITNCSNNYGPFQFPEKLIPVIVMNAINGQPLPIYGDGSNVRDWLFVEDHAAALGQVLGLGKPGETYAIGGHNERTNLELVTEICAILDELLPDSAYAPHASLVRFVTDRPGHDRRYAIDAGKIERELGWRPSHDLASGLRKTVEWYVANPDWCAQALGGELATVRQGIG